MRVDVECFGSNNLLQDFKLIKNVAGISVLNAKETIKRSNVSFIAHFLSL